MGMTPMVRRRGAARGLAAWLSLALAAGPAAAAVADFLRGQVAAQGRDFVSAARVLPAGRYGDATSLETMNFAELVLHIADGNYLYCSAIGATAQPALPALNRDSGKDALLRRLQESFDFCSQALRGLDDARLGEVLAIGNTRSPRAMAILTLTGSWNQHLAMAQETVARHGKPAAP